MATFKGKFKNLWERRGLDQARMADLLGYSPQTFNKRVNGKLKMKRADILKALEVLSSVSPVSAEDANELLELAGYEGLTDANEPDSTTVAQGSNKEGLPDINQAQGLTFGQKFGQEIDRFLAGIPAVLRRIIEQRMEEALSGVLSVFRGVAEFLIQQEPKTKVGIGADAADPENETIEQPQRTATPSLPPLMVGAFYSERARLYKWN